MVGMAFGLKEIMILSKKYSLLVIFIRWNDYFCRLSAKTVFIFKTDFFLLIPWFNASKKQKSFWNMMSDINMSCNTFNTLFVLLVIFI